jgi:hypothetical protein
MFQPDDQTRPGKHPEVNCRGGVRTELKRIFQARSGQAVIEFLLFLDDLVSFILKLDEAERREMTR